MLGYENLPGRRCPLTEDKCHFHSCVSKCHGLEAAKALKESSPVDPSCAAGAFHSAVGHLPTETQKAVDQYIQGGEDLDVFKNFMDDKLKSEE